MPRIRFHTAPTSRPLPDAGIRLPLSEPEASRTPGPQHGIRLPATATEPKLAR